MIVKICGVTRPEDAALAAAAGADWIGLNFWPGSKRALTADRGREVAAAVPAGVLKVGVFVNASFDEISAISETVGLDLIQLHGDEDAGLCSRFAGRCIRALRVGALMDLEQIHGFPDVGLFLLDAASTGYGGSGRSFDWSLARAAVAAGKRILLAGGLTPENVAQAARAVAPFGVDVAGGVESAPGVKDPDKLRRFLAAAKYQ